MDNNGTDHLRRVRTAAANLRELAHRISDLEDRLYHAKQDMQHLQHEQLPDLMDIAGIDRIGLPAADNFPACDVVLNPYFHANISTKWSPERQATAFDALTESGNGDLIKCQIHISLPRGERELAAKILATLQNYYGISAELKEFVHNATLTAWLREQWEAHRPTPALDLIGATVGRIARLIERKD